MSFKIFVINPGSTSTKVAVFEASKCVFDKTIRHNTNELKEYVAAVSQFEYRFANIQKVIDAEGIDFNKMDAFAGRGGLLKPLKGGTYKVEDSMLEDLKSSIYGDHASNLGAMIADRLAKKYGKSAYIVDPPVVDELIDEARFTGLPHIKRKSVFHALNQKATAIRAAAEIGMEYNKCRVIVAHLGGGISVGAHELGRVIDVNNALEEGPFSPERAGTLPSEQLVELCFSGKFTKMEIKKMLVGGGGLIAFTGTTDCKRIEDEIKSNEINKRVLDAMIYKISREICASAASLSGKIDRIVITGGLAYSDHIVEGIRNRVSFLGSIVVYPGEEELAALAEGVIRVLEGKEEVNKYDGEGG